MNKPNEPDLLKLPQLITIIVGLHPAKQSIFIKLYVLSYILLTLLFWYLGTIEVLIVYKDLEVLSQALEAITVLIHATGKWLSFMTNQSRLLIMYNTRKSFWHISKCDNDLEEECKTILQRTKWLSYIFLFLGNLVMILFSLTLFITDPIELPLLCYIPEGWNVHLLAYSQTFVNFNLVESILAADLLFIGLCMELVVQIKLLGGCLKALDIKQIKDQNDYKQVLGKLKEYVNHHNLLISHYNNISELLTFSFFAQYAVCTLTICFELYMILESDDFILQIFIRGIVYVVTISVELSLYCFISEYLSDEMSNIGNTVWNSGWYGNDQTSLQKSLNFVLLKTNQQKEFTAGGIMNVNSKTYTNVFKTAFSFFTFMRTIKGK